MSRSDLLCADERLATHMEWEQQSGLWYIAHCSNLDLSPSTQSHDCAAWDRCALLAAAKHILQNLLHSFLPGTLTVYRRCTADSQY